MELIVEVLHERWRWLHQVLRDEVRGLTLEQLDFVPAPGTNSIGVLVTHTLGSEAEIVSMVASSPISRNRPAEFTSKGKSADELIAQIDAADRRLDELLPRIDYAALERTWERPNGEAQTGAYWLINNFSHGREHMGHLQLTKQLFPDRFGGVVRPL